MPSDDKSLKQIAEEKNSTNPSQLGDPVSLKAETADSKPTEQDLGAKSGDTVAPGKGDNDHKSLKQIAQEKMDKGNPSQLGDPVSLKAETADSEPTPDDRGALGTNKTGKPKM